MDQHVASRALLQASWPTAGLAAVAPRSLAVPRAHPSLHLHALVPRPARRAHLSARACRPGAQLLCLYLVVAPEKHRTQARVRMQTHQSELQHQWRHWWREAGGTALRCCWGKPSTLQAQEGVPPPLLATLH